MFSEYNKKGSIIMDFDKLAKEIFDIKMKVIKSGEICEGVNYKSFVISYPEAVWLLKEALPDWDKEFPRPVEDMVHIEVSPFGDNAYGLRSTKIEGSGFYMRLHKILKNPEYFINLMKMEEVLYSEILKKDVRYEIKDEKSIFVSAGTKTFFIKNGTAEEIIKEMRELLWEV